MSSIRERRKYARRYYAKNKIELRRKSRERRKKNIDKHLAWGRSYRKKNLASVTKRQRRYRKKNKIRIARQMREYDNRLKTRVLSQYGLNGELRCSWKGCLVVDIDMLTLDHIEDDGAQDRRQNGSGGRSLYARLHVQGFPSGFQTLCWNHQWKKQITKLRRYGRSK